MNLQDLFDGMCARHQRERSKTQMTLGKMIGSLEAMSGSAEIVGLGDLYSYRGYYSDLAFEPTETFECASELLVRCKGAMGKVFRGYKGGEYMMGELTPLWVAPHGCCGKKIMGISGDGKVETADEDD